ncbi:hypothetical protein SCP_1304010 [Sparassis crispa]|uniref:Uncharacterized protein n=1 Tax=Sparassis crispa TaxID=139825 RepID=A0A401H2D8_9APHY|nr:hypothetical protein SCP_1304010 [Sparassis crispa]GBE88584.1 hypothetical protein SCP_1304010 [Sparassis crispa]
MAPTAGRSRLVSPPPPPAQRSSRPPVPPVPRHLAGQGSFPAHLSRRHHGGLPPVIAANPEPLPFESLFDHLPHRHHTPPVHAPPAAARSHHQPVMGLGGALIALNRDAVAEANSQEERRRAMPEREEPPRSPSQGRARRTRAPWADNTIIPYDDFLPVQSIDDGFFDWAGADYPLRSGRTGGLDEPKYYKPTYTHPDKPMPGFTFDFAPAEMLSSSGASSPTVIVLDDDEAVSSSGATTGSASTSSSTTAVETTLVCAQCLDPLVRGALTEDQRKMGRIWVLRCGHIVDGKCIEELMHPATQELVGEEVESKGKAKAEPEDAAPMEPLVQDRKGKGKATGISDLSSMPAVPELEVAENSIRSRLRSRRPPASLKVGTTGAASESARHPPGRLARILPRRRQHPATPAHAKGKGKGRARRAHKPAIEAEHSWVCPVAGCGHVHVSICVDGVWKMDEERGAIAAFV